MQDPRLRERRSVHVLGIAVCGALALICIHHFLSGVVTGEVPCIPFKRGCRAWRLHYSSAADPGRYAFGLVFWLGFGVISLVFAWYIGVQLAWAGGLFGTADERLMRRIALHRRRVDRAIFGCLAQVAARSPSARLELTWETRQGEAHLRHELAGGGGEGGTAAPEALYRATAELLDTFRRHGRAFRKSVYCLSRGPDGRWQRSLTVE